MLESYHEQVGLLSRLLIPRLKRFRLELAILLEQYLDLSLGLLEFFPALARKLHAFLEQRQGLLQRNFAFFQISNNLFQALERLLEFQQVKEAPIS
jgi:hypothetical protein